MAIISHSAIFFLDQRHEKQFWGFSSFDHIALHDKSISIHSLTHSVFSLRTEEEMEGIKMSGRSCKNGISFRVDMHTIARHRQGTYHSSIGKEAKKEPRLIHLIVFKVSWAVDCSVGGGGGSIVWNHATHRKSKEIRRLLKRGRKSKAKHGEHFLFSPSTNE